MRADLGQVLLQGHKIAQQLKPVLIFDNFLGFWYNTGLVVPQHQPLGGMPVDSVQAPFHGSGPAWDLQPAKRCLHGQPQPAFLIPLFFPAEPFPEQPPRFFQPSGDFRLPISVVTPPGSDMLSPLPGDVAPHCSHPNCPDPAKTSERPRVKFCKTSWMTLPRSDGGRPGSTSGSSSSPSRTFRKNRQGQARAVSKV